MSFAASIPMYYNQENLQSLATQIKTSLVWTSKIQAPILSGHPKQAWASVTLTHLPEEKSFSLDISR